METVTVGLVVVERTIVERTPKEQTLVDDAVVITTTHSAIHDQYAILRFGGGCQGCSAVDVTLKSGVEKTLLEQLPQLQGVRDMTDHSDTSRAYY